MFNKSNRQTNSHSKSKGSKHHNRDQSTENNSRHQKVSNTLSSNEFKSKLKTQKSLTQTQPHLHIDDSKQKLKNKHIKRVQKNNSNSKNETDRRLNSTQKVICTQPRDQELQVKIQEIIQNLQKIKKPVHQITQIKLYLNQIEKTFVNIAGPLQSFLLFLHKMYINSLNDIFQLILPIETLIIRRSQLIQKIQNQTLQNQKLNNKKNIQNQNLQIQKLRQLIENQAKLIEQKKDIKDRFEKLKQYLKELEKNKKRHFKIDLEDINKNKQILSYHDQFYDHINEFSESWRNQALKQLRF